jgi:hypothetical protein
MKSAKAGKAALLRVVSMWKTLTCLSSRLPMRFMEACMAELGGSIRERVWESVSGVWWYRIEEYGERPVWTDLCPPSMGM